MAFLNRSSLGEDDVAVDEVVYEEEFDSELLASLNLKEGDEVEFGVSNDPSRTVAAIKEEMLGKSISPTMIFNGSEPTTGTQPTLT